MADPVAETIAYYDRNAASFAAQTAGLDLTPLHDHFLRHVAPGGRILDAGCGAGRDTLAFIERGYEVVAFDASAEMVRQTRARADDRAVVHHMRFADMDWHACFDAIWCCASLLHVPADDFPAVAACLLGALKPGGIWYMSFKLGSGERMAEGRLFTDHTEASLRQSLADMPVEITELWVSEDMRPGRSAERWVNALVQRHR